MNERIQQLADQARQYAREYVADCKHYGHYMEHNELEVKFEEKFAELIVRECCSAIRLDDAFNGGKFQRTILKHFGVEE
jgi:hypothetical protein